MCLPSCDSQINVLKKGLNVKAARRPSASKMRKNLAKVMPKVAISKEESEDDEEWLEEVDPDQNGEQQREQIEMGDVERDAPVAEGARAVVEGALRGEGAAEEGVAEEEVAEERADGEGVAEEGAAEEGEAEEGEDEEGTAKGVQDAEYDADAEEETEEQQTTSF